jgi:hypothetical protein
MNREMPKDGGSYRRLPDGSLEVVSPTTGSRPCKCGPGEIQNNDPDAPLAPPIEHVEQPEVYDLAEKAAEPGEALPALDNSRRAKSRK